MLARLQALRRRSQAAQAQDSALQPLTLLQAEPRPQAAPDHVPAHRHAHRRTLIGVQLWLPDLISVLKEAEVDYEKVPQRPMAHELVCAGGATECIGPELLSLRTRVVVAADVWAPSRRFVQAAWPQFEHL